MSKEASEHRSYVRKLVATAAGLAFISTYGLVHAEYVLEPFLTLLPVAATFAAVGAAEIVKRIWRRI